MHLTRGMLLPFLWLAAAPWLRAQPPSSGTPIPSKGFEISLWAREPMLKNPVAQVSLGAWSKQTAADLRMFLIQRMEEAIERRLITAPVLEAS